MELTSWVLFVLALVPSFLYRTQATAANDNVQEFLIFCRLANLAEREPTKITSENGVNVTSVVEDLQHFALITKAGGGLEAPGLRAEWVSQNLGRQRTGVSGRYATSLRRKLELGQKLAQPCIDWEEQSPGLGDQIKLELKQGLFGSSSKVGPRTQATDLEPGDVFVDGTPSSNAYGRSCGGSIESVGKSLVNDIYCLCVSKAASGTQAVCAQGITGDGGNWPKINSNAVFPNSWATVYGACPPNKQKFSPSAIYAAVEAFQSLIGRTLETAATNENFRYAFGKATAGSDCDGVGGGGSVCVSYKAVMKKDNKGIEGIPWVAKYLAAANRLRQAERLAEKCAQNSHKLQLLHEQAIFLFNESVVSHSGAPTNWQKGGLDNASATATVSEKDQPSGERHLPSGSRSPLLTSTILVVLSLSFV